MASSSDKFSITSVPQLPQTRWKNIKLGAYKLQAWQQSLLQIIRQHLLFTENKNTPKLFYA